MRQSDVVASTQTDGRADRGKYRCLHKGKLSVCRGLSPEQRGEVLTAATSDPLGSPTLTGRGLSSFALKVMTPE